MRLPRCFLPFFPMVVALPATAATVDRAMTSPLPTAALLQVALALGGILLLIFGGAWLLRRVGKFSSAANGQIRILGGTSLGSRERVVLMQVGERQLLLGVAPGRVTTLHVFDVATPAVDMTTEVAPGAGFRELLRRKTAARAVGS